MNSYWIKTKEVAKKGYFIDGKFFLYHIIKFYKTLNFGIVIFARKSISNV